MGTATNRNDVIDYFINPLPQAGRFRPGGLHVEKCLHSLQFSWCFFQFNHLWLHLLETTLRSHSTLVFHFRRSFQIFLSRTSASSAKKLWRSWSLLHSPILVSMNIYVVYEHVKVSRSDSSMNSPWEHAKYKLKPLSIVAYRNIARYLASSWKPNHFIIYNEGVQYVNLLQECLNPLLAQIA